MRDKAKLCVLLGYIAVMGLVWLLREPILALLDRSALESAVLKLIFPALSILGLAGLLRIFGGSLGCKLLHNNFERVGFVSSAGETPQLIAKCRDKENPKLTINKFETASIPLKEWEDKRHKVASAMNAHIEKIIECESKRRINVYAVSAKTNLPTKLMWNDSYLSQSDTIFILGESLTGTVRMDVSKTNNILLGGSTGGGKTNLLQLLVYQAIRKGWQVVVGDLKGGCDFSEFQCKVLSHIGEVQYHLGTLVAELDERKEKVRSAGVTDIDEYNQRAGDKLERILFACDEVAELLDKTGRDKSSKEIISIIEGYLATLARQGRAFGIHLFLATQRPDANVLPGQIRNNIDYRVCGRAESVLSQIVLDSSIANEIPKDIPGRFVNHEAVVFQAYWFNARKAFDDLERGQT